MQVILQPFLSVIPRNQYRLVKARALHWYNGNFKNIGIEAPVNVTDVFSIWLYLATLNWAYPFLLDQA